ncbi:hypothetical protein HY003_01100 [Candidatus Saccharibacteria bacterium]|nr:hypothetical protein [Candidatus Saccharibacteria bacterium]MBI3337874.1 hypothetical protein [Candidatus Saccharibacteria bacterium]
MKDEIMRPTKKQKATLEFIGLFIGQHGYSPSYREIMTALNYSSVATVALHVNSLIKRGHLRKRDHSARSLEVVKIADVSKLQSNEIKPGEEKWLIERVEYFFRNLDQDTKLEQKKLDELYVLVGALKVLGLDGAVQSFLPKLSVLKKRVYTSRQ